MEPETIDLTDTLTRLTVSFSEVRRPTGPALVVLGDQHSLDPVVSEGAGAGYGSGDGQGWLVHGVPGSGTGCGAEAQMHGENPWPGTGYGYGRAQAAGYGFERVGSWTDWFRSIGRIGPGMPRRVPRG